MKEQTGNALLGIRSDWFQKEKSTNQNEISSASSFANAPTNPIQSNPNQKNINLTPPI